MKSKSFPRAAATFSVYAVLLLLSGGWLAAQSPSPSPSPKPPKPKVGRVRFWNATPTTTDTSLDLVISGGGVPERLLNSAGPSNFYARYVNLPPGSYHLRVFKRDDRQNVIKSIDLALRDKSYYTLLATQLPEGPLDVELVDDTPNPTKTPVNRVTVRQLCPNLTGVITATGNFRSNTLTFGKTQTLEGLPDGKVILHLQATKSGNSTRSWDSETDFRVSRHATMFIVNDVYGRLSPHLSMDGPSPTEEAEAAEEAKDAETSKTIP